MILERINKWLRNTQEKNRKRKIELFIRLCNPRVILDVGITGREYHPFDNLLEKMYAGKLPIVGLGIEDLSEISRKYKIPCIVYKGNTFPLKDNSIDVVYSNAVIEHVGDQDKQKHFLFEMVRVAQRAVFFTTPNRWFPVELHTKVPFLHYLPKKCTDSFYNFLGIKWATGDYMNLLSKNQILKLLKEVSLHYRIRFNLFPQRFLGFPVTYSVFIEKFL